MESFPPELIERIIYPLSLNDCLQLRGVCYNLNEIIAPRIRQLNEPEKCELSFLRLQAVCGIRSTVFITAKPAHFESRPLNLWRRENQATWEVDGYLELDIPKRVCDIAPVLEKAWIGHFIVGKNLPFYFDDGKSEILNRLLTGSKIKEATLVLDKQTMTNLNEIAHFLKTFHCKTVEFFLEMTAIFEMIEPFGRPEFAAKLAAAGIRQVIFSGDPIYGRQQPHKLKINSRERKLYFPFYVLTNLVRAGITNIVVNRHTFEEQRFNPDGKEFFTFLNEIASIGKQVEIIIECIVHDTWSLKGGMIVGEISMNCVRRKERIMGRIVEWNRVIIRTQKQIVDYN